MPQTIVNTVKNRIYSRGKGWVFTPNHFSDLGSDTGVRTALSRLQKDGTIRRLSHGIYDYPRTHEILGVVPPSADALAKAYAEKNGAQIQVSGAHAANLAGLSEQVPGRYIFLTDGPTRKLKAGRMEISFKKTTVKNMFAAGSREALIVQALKYMQKKHVDELMLRRAKRVLTGTTRRDFERNLKFAPQWIRSLLFELMKEDLGLRGHS